MRGTKKIMETGNMYSLEDGYSVFDNMSNTPSAHRKNKYEQMARLDNLGAFQIFFTMSCADTRWLENISSFFAESGIQLIYNVDNDGKSNISIRILDEEYVSLDQYLSTLPESFHEILRKKCGNGYKNFQASISNFLA